MVESDTRLRVVVVDDHAVVRSGIKAEIGHVMDVVGEADDVEGAVDVIAGTQPDVVLLDVHLPGGGGPAVIAGVRSADVETRFLALSASDAEDDVMAVVRAGARGYVTKSIEGDDLVDAVERVAEGDAVFSRRLAGFVLDAFAPQIPEAEIDPEFDQLTPREREVLHLLARGHPYRRVANRLGISVKTVESHSRAVMRKLQLTNRYELARWAADRRLG